MKKLLLSSTVLFLFSASILIFQVSCKKEANADTQQKTSTEQEKIVLLRKYENGTLSLYTVKIDGTNLKKLSLSFPSNVKLYDIEAKITADGKQIVFTGEFTYNDNDSFNIRSYTTTYTCDIDGHNLKEIENLSGYWMQDVY